MVTTVIHTIKPGGGGHFSSLEAWRVGGLVLGDPGYPVSIVRNLVSLDQIEIVEIYSGGDAGGLNLTAAGWTTDSTHYVHIRAAAGHEHGGTFNTNKAYIADASNLIVYGPVILYVNYTKIGPGLSISGGIPINIAGHFVVADGCILKHNTNIWGGYGGVSLYNVLFECTIKNCVITTTTSANMGAIHINSGSSGSFKVYNCTIISNENTSCAGIYNNSPGTATISSQNNYFNVPNGRAYYGSAINKGANDATSTIEATTANLRSVAYSTANFINVTSGSEDLHIKSGSVLNNAGAYLVSQGVTTDIDGVSRVGFLFDIGADQRNDVPMCWNYTAHYKNSNKLFKASGCGVFPKTLQVPSNVDISTGKMVDDGIFINPDKYKII